MKIAESWLREWVNPDLDTDALAHQLTMLGHEVDALHVLGEGIADVVIAEVREVGKHPGADRLQVCKVDDGSGDPIEVVCGAPNVRQGMKSPLARPGVTLPNGLKLRKSKIRGVVSNGMLCSAIELGIGEESDGIIELPADARPGTSIAEFLGLPDAIIDLNLTPNRGDCFSVQGIARDVAALTGGKLTPPAIDPVAATVDDTRQVELEEPAGCPRFAGRVIRGIDARAGSPIWLTERLRRAGLRAISPVVDITNYVMLELGQPLHAYDNQLLQGSIRPRLAKPNETVVLLDDREVQLNDQTMIITDDSGPIGIAGIMGGLSTAVTANTTDVFFEAAFWPPEFMAGRARAFGLHTDASLRFERGVDPEGQGRAIERATSLLLDIAGGQAGPLVVDSAEQHLPMRNTVRLRKHQLARLLGLDIDDNKVMAILKGLELDVATTTDGWNITPPSHRFDIEIEADLIEEVARIHGYDAVPETTAMTAAPLETVTEVRVDLERAADTLIARDYQEVVTYSFIDAEENRAFTGSDSALVLSNPISQEMSVMRASLWPGMAAVAATNVARQQERVRIFEASKSFHGALGSHSEVLRIAGLATGPDVAEQWGRPAENVDLFDIKSDVEALLSLASKADEIRFVPVEHPALQSGQAAEILRNDEHIGSLGKLHPGIARRYDLKRPVFVFELDAAKALAATLPRAAAISRFPAIRRDIAIIVEETVSANDLLEAVAGSAPDLIQDVRIFDIYQGPGIEAGRKSVAIGLILQETSRTLTDDDADVVMAATVSKLKDQFAAELRD